MIILRDINEYIMKHNMKRLVYIFLMCLFSCTAGESGPTTLEKAGVIEFYNQAAGRGVSQYGEVIGCTMKTMEAYSLELVFNTDDVWAQIEKGASGNKGFNTIRIKFDPNQGEEERVAELFIAVQGYEKTSLAVFRQSVIVSDLERNRTLNRHMHQRLRDEYLWAAQYSDLDVDLDMDYAGFLETHLLQLGDVNIEDGGYTKGHVSNPGERFIYSNIVAQRPVTKSGVQNAGMGFGPFFDSALSESGEERCLAVSYVHRGSPADLAGICRGDAIYMVNGEYITSDNYENMNRLLLSSTSGNYQLRYFRNAQVQDEKVATVSAGIYDYDPVICCEVIEKAGAKIGYLVLESFDYESHASLAAAVGELREKNITDLVLDLRFNAGGSMAQSRWLTGCIAGAAYKDEIFANLVYNDGQKEEWRFRGGPDNYDGMGMGPDLGLDRVYVIGSYYTASASEMVVTSLRGVDFDICLIGGKTEGKNVGMTVSELTVDGVRYVFSPITFRIENAKGVSGYDDGLIPDVEISDQDLDFEDSDIDMMFPYSFGDWLVDGANTALEIALGYITGAARTSLAVMPAAVRLLAPCSRSLTPGCYGSYVK